MVFREVAAEVCSQPADRAISYSGYAEDTPVSEYCLFFWLQQYSLSGSYLMKYSI